MVKITTLNRRPVAQPSDWPSIKEMPRQHAIVHPQRQFGAKDMKKICRGFIPTTQDQRWFIYFTSNRLRLHRSWTGFLIYDVGFEFDFKGGASIADIVVNRNGRQYKSKDDENDLNLLYEVIQQYLLQPVPSYSLEVPRN